MQPPRIFKTTCKFEALQAKDVNYPSGFDQPFAINATIPDLISNGLGSDISDSKYVARMWNCSSRSYLYLESPEMGWWGGSLTPSSNPIDEVYQGLFLFTENLMSGIGRLSTTFRFSLTQLFVWFRISILTSSCNVFSEGIRRGDSKFIWPGRAANSLLACVSSASSSWGIGNDLCLEADHLVLHHRQFASCEQIPKRLYMSRDRKRHCARS